MPTFTPIDLEVLLEPGASRSGNNSVPNLKPPIPIPKPIPNSKMEKSSSTSLTRKVNQPQISPALYATPEATPLPDSPSSFPPSPYIINHKRRGPRLSKCFSEENVSSWKKNLEENEVNGNAKLAGSKSVNRLKDGFGAFSIPEPNEEEHENASTHNCPIYELENGVHGGSIQEEHMNGFNDGEFGSCNGKVGSSRMNNGLAMDASIMKVEPLNLDRSGESEDFFDPNESMSVVSNTEGGNDTGAETAASLATPGVEFFDAWDELSSESTPQPIARDIEAELREIRLSLLMEIEKRKQAEEALNKTKCKWRRISQELGGVGLSLPADPLDVTEDELVNPAEELRQRMDVAGFVSLSVGRGIARADIEMEMEAQIESKNFEIARLWDRLHYYEAMNREMSQRNQEAVEMARRDRQRKKRRHRWVWGSVATAITLGTAALAWSYLPAGKGSSSANIPKDPDPDNSTAK